MEPYQDRAASESVQRHEQTWRRIPAAQRRAWLNLLRIQRDTVAHLDEALATHGLSLAEWDALVHIPAQGVRMSDLAHAIVLSPSGLTRMVGRLERQGFVERRRGDQDAREMHVALAKKGQLVLDEAAATHNDELVGHLFHALTIKEWETVDALLSKVADAPTECKRHP